MALSSNEVDWVASPMMYWWVLLMSEMNALSHASLKVPSWARAVKVVSADGADGAAATSSSPTGPSDAGTI